MSGSATQPRPPVDVDAKQGVKRSQKGRGGQKKGGGAGGAGASDSSPAAPKKYKGEVFLVVSLSVCGRSPLNGWILSLGAVLVAAERRRVLGLLERNLLPLSTHHRVEPAADTVGFLRRQRPELEYFSRNRCGAMEAMADLGQFCAPYSNVTLVGSPLMSVYGWLSYYWTAYQQYTVDQVGQASLTTPPPPPPPMPWGFSGLCARSFIAGCLGVSMKAVLKDERYLQASAPLEALGLPLADALSAAASFTHFYISQSQLPPQHEADEEKQMPSKEMAPVISTTQAPSPILFECLVPNYLIELGAVPADLVPPAQTPPPTPCQRTLLELVIDASIRQGLAHHAPPSPPKSPLNASGALATTGQHPASAVFSEYPSITSLDFHPDFVSLLPTVLRETEPWVATEKVHGSNITIFCDGKEIWAGKRTGWLALRDTTTFFDFVYLLEAARPAILACHAKVSAWVRARDAGAQPLVVAVVCELAGGDYPHAQVPVDIRGTRVQSGVYYCNSNFLYGFDVGVESLATVAPSLAASLVAEMHTAMESSPPPTAAAGEVSFMPWGPDGRYYLPFDDAHAIFEATQFPTYTTARREGTFAALHSDENIAIFPSYVPRDWFGLPSLEDNMAEGVVLRPRRDWWMCKTTSTTSGEGDEGGRSTWSRVMVKVKHPRFSEFSHKTEPAAKGAAAGALSITDFLTEARVSAVLSKHSQEEQQDTAKMVKAVLADAMKDAKALDSHIT